MASSRSEGAPTDCGTLPFGAAGGADLWISRIDWMTPPVTATTRKSSCCAEAVAAQKSRTQRTLFRQALDEVGGREQHARRAERAEPARVDALDLARAVKARERPVHGEAEVRIAARQHERVLLDREILVEEP